MILLTNTTESLELQTSSVASTDYTVGYADNTTTTFIPGSGQGNIASITTTTIIPAPAASTQRQVKLLTIRNKGTVQQTVTIKKDVSGTEYILIQVTLLPGESIYYVDGVGFRNLDGSGREKIYNPDHSGGADGFSQALYKIGTAPEAAGKWYSFAKDTGNPGAWAPGTPGLGGRATDGTAVGDTGCLRIANPASGNNYLTGFGAAGSVVGNYWLFDVLWINSGIVVTTTTAQTVTSVAFPARDALGAINGEGCWIGILVTTVTTNGAAITNMTVSYTNSDGVAGRTATMASFAQSAVVGTVEWFQLAAGDRGVQSIQSITLGTSLVTGAVSMIVARPLANVAGLLAQVGSEAGIDPRTGIKLYNGSCILPIMLASATTATTLQGTFSIAAK
jgi:hypothetical protein